MDDKGPWMTLHDPMELHKFDPGSGTGAFQDGPPDQFGHLGHDGVAESLRSVQPMGNPIIASNSEGCG